MTALTQTQKKAQSAAFNPWIALLIGICAGTFAAPFIKLTQQGGLPSPVIAFGRMTLAALILTPLVLSRYRAELARLTQRDLVMAIFAGLLLQTHFQLLIFALERTSTLIVLVIVNTGPLWVALLERVFLKERINRFVWVGMAITIVGSLYIALSANQASVTNDNSVMIGAILSILAAMAGAGYMTVGRSVRKKVSLFPYVWILFGAGGLIGLVGSVMAGVPIAGHPLNGYFWLVMLTLIPQLLGHSGFNFALGYFTATLTSLSSQLLTVTASVVAFFLFAEVPTLSDIIGSAIIGLGVLLAIIYRTRSTAQ
ncbi:MAG: DMT family transporter [Anaerolineae bacterium]